MKKLLVLSFAITLLGLAACGSDSTDTPSTSDEAAGEATPMEEVVGDSTAAENGSATGADTAGTPGFKDKTVDDTASSGESE